MNCHFFFFLQIEILKFIENNTNNKYSEIANRTRKKKKKEAKEI